jgi:hypothetical protein
VINAHPSLAPGGPVLLTWTNGAPAGTLVITFDLITGVSSTLTPAVGATFLIDSAPGQWPCYIVAYGSSLTDLLCSYLMGAGPAEVPDFRLSANGGLTTTTTWGPSQAAAATDYLVVVIPFDGAAARVYTTPLSVRSQTDPTAGVFTCYIVVTDGAEGNSDLDCVAPGVATAAAASTGSPASTQAQVERMTQRLRDVRSNVQRSLGGGAISPARVREAARSAQRGAR